MIQIKSTINRNLDQLADQHYENAYAFLIKKLKYSASPRWLITFLSDNLYKIITGLPSELILLNKEYKRLSTKNRYDLNLANTYIQEVFEYNWLAGDKKRAYNFASQLLVNSCPYCNRNYTVTVLETNGGKGIVRPDFDHFFPKSKYPLLALSFFNLVPCCPICNRSIKGSHETKYEKNIHPYEDGFGSALKINYKANDTDSLIGLKRNLDIKILLSPTESKKAQKCKNNFNLFRLKEIYQASHLEEISLIIRKHYVSGGTYLETLHKQFPKLGTIEELYKIAFFNYYNEEDFGARPLSKLTKDIFEQLNFIMPKLK